MLCVDVLLVLNGAVLLQWVELHEVAFGFLQGVPHCLKYNITVYVWCLSGILTFF